MYNIQTAWVSEDALSKEVKSGYPLTHSVHYWVLDHDRVCPA